MKRDENYANELLKALWESEKSSQNVATLPPERKNDPRKTHHLALLEDRGLIVETQKLFYRLTDAGHNYLENLEGNDQTDPATRVS